MSKVRIYNTESGRALDDMEKSESHRQIKEAILLGQPQPHVHAHVAALLLDSNMNFLSTTRDFLADVNADLIDKTLGGHIQAGFTPSSGLLEVGNREFQIPTAVVTKEELTTIIKHHPVLLKRQAFLVQVDYIDGFSSRRIDKDATYDEACIQHVYVGVFDGSYRSSRGTAVRPIAADDLFKHVKTSPEKFTGDLIDFATIYEREIGRLLGTISRSNYLRQRGGLEEELIESVDVDTDEFVCLEQRKNAHVPIMESYRKKQQQKHKHSHIGGILEGWDGEIYVQIRSDKKAENPGKYDKIVGGHIPESDTPVVAAYHEFLEEMGIPIAIYGQRDWENILRTFPEAINYQAICAEPIKIRNYKSIRKPRNGKPFVETCDQFFVLGYYGGSFQFTDREASGVYRFSNLAALEKEMHEHPDKFTDDLKYMIELYRPQLVPLAERFRKAV